MYFWGLNAQMHAFPFGNIKSRLPKWSTVTYILYTTVNWLLYEMSMKYKPVKFCRSIRFHLPEKVGLDRNMKSTMPCLVSFASNFLPLSSPLLHSLCTARVKAFLTHDISPHISWFWTTSSAMQDNFIKAAQGLTCHPADQKHTVPFSTLATEEEKKIFKGQSASF